MLDVDAVVDVVVLGVGGSMVLDVNVDHVVDVDVDVLDVGGSMVLDVESKEANGRQPSLRGLFSR